MKAGPHGSARDQNKRVCKESGALRVLIEQTVNPNGQDGCSDLDVSIRVKNLQPVDKVIREGNSGIATDLAPV